VLIIQCSGLTPFKGSSWDRDMERGPLSGNGRHSVLVMLILVLILVLIRMMILVIMLVLMLALILGEGTTALGKLLQRRR
jgi:hypothetical protein